MIVRRGDADEARLYSTAFPGWRGLRNGRGAADF